MILHFRPKALLIKRESTNVIGCEEDTDIKDKNKWQIDSNTLIAESKYWVSEKLIQSGFNANWTGASLKADGSLSTKLPNMACFINFFRLRYNNTVRRVIALSSTVSKLHTFFFSMLSTLLMFVTLATYLFP